MLSILGLKGRLSYGWVVVATPFIIGTTILGVRLSFGVFFKSLAGEFDLTRATTSAVFSTHMVISAVFAFVVGWALDRYGPWMMGPSMMGGFGWMWLMPIFWILFLRIIVWGIVALVRGVS